MAIRRRLSTNARGETTGVSPGTAQLRIAILLDITGSMSDEIEAVKKASAEFVRLSGEDFLDEQLATAIITFTESGYSYRRVVGITCQQLQLSEPHFALSMPALHG